MLAATLVVAAGTGCSEDKQAQAPATTSTPTTTPVVPRPKPGPHQSRWAKQVDNVCKPWQERIDAVTPQPTDTASLEAWLKGALPLVRKQIAAVKAVKRPAKTDEARKVRLFLDSLQKTERALTTYLAAIQANAPAKVRRRSPRRARQVQLHVGTRCRSTSPSAAATRAAEFRTRRGRGRQNKTSPPMAGSFEVNPAATYSPGRLPSEYHRPWQA